jgi:hypothetical protein
MSNNLFPCPSGCTDDIPDVLFVECTPEINFGEIATVAITKIGYPLTNVEDPAEWAARIALPSGDDEKIYLISVIGDMPAPEVNEYVVSHCRKVQSNKDFTVNIEVDETNDLNYEFMRWTQCNPTVLAWLVTNNHIRGGNDGIEVNIILNDQIDKDCKSIQKFIGKLTWTGANFPARTANVLP